MQGGPLQYKDIIISKRASCFVHLCAEHCFDMHAEAVLGAEERARCALRTPVSARIDEAVAA